MVTCIAGEVAEIDLSGGHLDSVDSSQVRVRRGTPPPNAAIRGGVPLPNSVRMWLNLSRRLVMCWLGIAVTCVR